MHSVLTLMPAHKGIVEVFISGEWALGSVSCIPNMPGNYQHQIVDHSRNFVDPMIIEFTQITSKVIWSGPKLGLKPWMGHQRIWSRATWTSSCDENVLEPPIIWHSLTFCATLQMLPLLDGDYDAILMCHSTERKTTLFRVTKCIRRYVYATTEMCMSLVSA